jgi:HSP20 family protein
MFLTKWRPTWGLTRRERDFDDLFHGLVSNGELVNYRNFNPAVDIVEEEDRFLIKADLPGMAENDIDVKVHDGVLVLSGKREETKEERTEGGFYSERRYGSFCRQFTLGSSVDAQKIEASYDKGVLTVSLPKKEETKPRQIAISNN